MKRKETTWIEIRFTDREIKSICRAAGTTVREFERYEDTKVDDFIRRAAVKAAKSSKKKWPGHTGEAG